MVRKAPKGQINVYREALDVDAKVIHGSREYVGTEAFPRAFTSSEPEFDILRACKRVTPEGCDATFSCRFEWTGKENVHVYQYFSREASAELARRESARQQIIIDKAYDAYDPAKVSPEHRATLEADMARSTDLFRAHAYMDFEYVDQMARLIQRAPAPTIAEKIDAMLPHKRLAAKPGRWDWLFGWRRAA